MAIWNPLTQEVITINERIRNRQDFGNIANEQLFGLLNTTPQKNLIIDGTMALHLGNLPSLLDIQQDITNLRGTLPTTAAGNNTTNNVITPAILTSSTIIQQTISQVNQHITNLPTNIANETQLIETESYNQWFTGNQNTIDQQRRNYINTQRNLRVNPLQAELSQQQRNLSILQQLLPLQQMWDVFQNIIGTPGNTNTNTRVGELTLINNIIRNILLINQNNFIPTIPPQTITYTGNITNIPLNWTFVPAGLTNGGNTYTIDYTLCNNQSGESLTRQNNGLQTTLVSGETVTITWLQLNGNQLTWTNIQIQPIEGLKFPINVPIAIRGRIAWPAGINLDHYKTFNLTINAPQLVWANAQNPTGANTPRATAYTNLNQWGTINNRLVAEYSDPTRTNIENEIIREILRANGNQAEIDKIYNNQQQRDLLIERIRNIPQLIPIFTIANLQNGFMSEMIRENRNVPIQHLVSINAFTDYLRNNLEENIRSFVRGQIRTAINTTGQRNNILRTVMDFQSDIINDKLDNNDHRTLDQNIPNIRPQGHPNNLWQRLTRRRSDKNNWTKFFDGRESKSFEDKIETNEGELFFDLKVAVHGVNKIVTTINIKGEDEPIILDTRDVNDMTHMILGLEATKSGEPINRKLRCHMALNAIKAVVTMSPVTLHREYQWNIIATDGQQYQIDRLSAHIRGENLVLRWSCANSHNNPPTQYRQRINHIIFDEKRYKWLHNINELERGMVGLSNQINGIMDAMGNEFRQATSRIKTAPLMKYDTKQYLRGWPIKRLWARIVYGKTNWKFDFDTTTISGSKTVNIKFEKGKFTISGTFKEKPFEFKGRSLGILLRKKIDRLRVFDGVELSIFEKINEAMIEQLRTNNLISPENFWVADLNQNKTGRIFFMDSQWDLSYIEIEDRNLNPLRGRNHGRINFNDLPPQRIRCNETERREFMQNPLLSGRLIRAMRKRLQLV